MKELPCIRKFSMAKSWPQTLFCSKTSSYAEGMNNTFHSTTEQHLESANNWPKENKRWTKVVASSNILSYDMA